jgi:hypothetical protein
MSRISRKLIQIKKDVARQCLLEGCSVKSVQCAILYERPEYYFVAMRNYYGSELWVMKFRLMKKDLAIIWSESWL